MSVNEIENEKRMRRFNTLGIVWISLIVVSAVLILAMSVTPPEVLPPLRPIFLAVGLAILLLAFLGCIMFITGYVSVDTEGADENLPWPVTLVAAFVVSSMLVSGPIIETRETAGTAAAVSQLAVLLLLFMLPFVVLEIAVPMLLERYYHPDGRQIDVRRVEQWGHGISMFLAFALWVLISDKSIAWLKDKLWPIIILAFAYATYLAVRAVIRRRRMSV